jgi:hypothetical protein
MARKQQKSLVDRLDDLLEEASIPEMVAALVHLSRGYNELLKAEDNREYLGWEAWEQALSAVLREVAGPEEASALLDDA